MVQSRVTQAIFDEYSGRKSVVDELVVISTVSDCSVIGFVTPVNRTGSPQDNLYQEVGLYK